MDKRLAALAARQGGAITRDQLLSALPPAEVRRRLRRGEWRSTPWRGIYVEAEVPHDLHSLVRAAALLAGGDLVACHTTAAALWGFGIFSDDRLHFLGPNAVDNRRRPGLQIHPSVLGTDDAVLVGGVWCTPPARTACDVVRLSGAIDGLAILDRALASGTCSRDNLVAASIEQAGLRQVIRLRWLIPRADPLAESPIESRMRWRFLEARLPAPACQIRVGDVGDRWHRLDTGWRDRRVGAEFDGGIAHLTHDQLRADRDRHNWLTENGWTLLHFTDIDVYRRHARMVATVRRLLDRDVA
ncbi:MAG: endonuclease domain-containing protein [Actinomycetota bacterium]|nr:endonuclease domain-containing protein [Actinomycetota bacterium]